MNVPAKTCACGGGCIGETPADRPRLDAMSQDHLSVTGRTVEFCCPVCARELPTSCSTKGHAPAESVGGRYVTRICRRCNSSFGHRYEGVTVSMLRTRIDGRSGTWTESLRVGSGREGRNRITVPVMFVRKADGGHEIHIKSPKRGTAAASRWDEEVRLIASQGAGTFEWTTPSPGLVARALMSWAYLAAFEVLGYRFALSPAGRLVADALLDPRSTVFGERCRINVEGADMGDLEPSVPVFWSTEGGADRLDAWGWRFGAWICLFPLPWDGEGQIYRKLDSIAAGGASSYGAGGEPRIEALQLLFSIVAARPSIT